MQCPSTVKLSRDLWAITVITNAQKMNFSIQDFFGKCDQIRKKLRIWSHLQNGKFHFLCSARHQFFVTFSKVDEILLILSKQTWKGLGCTYLN